VALQDQLEEKVYQNMLSIQGILTPEQRKQMHRLFSDFSGRERPGEALPGEPPHGPGFEGPRRPRRGPRNPK